LKLIRWMTLVAEVEIGASTPFDTVPPSLLNDILEPFPMMSCDVLNLFALSIVRLL
jgi:hypothetical protein